MATKLEERDFRTGDFGAFDWSPERVGESLEAVYMYLTSQARGAESWYWSAKRWPKRLAQWIRGLGILAVTGGTLLPLFAELYGIRAVWATVSLGVGAAILGADRYMGFSTAWTRYVLTAQKINKHLETFRLVWRKRMAQLAGQPPSDEDVQGFLDDSLVFSDNILGEVHEETRVWAEEFHRTMKLLDDAVQAREPGRGGAQRGTPPRDDADGPDQRA